MSPKKQQGHEGKSERKRRNREEKERLLEAFRQALLHRDEKQLINSIGEWMNLLVGEEDVAASLDGCCWLLGYQITSSLTHQSYPSYSAWRDAETHLEDVGAEFELENWTGFHHRIEALTLDELDALVDLAYRAESFKAEKDAQPAPPVWPTFILHLTNRYDHAL